MLACLAMGSDQQRRAGLTGRNAELAALDRSLARACAGAPALVLVRGPSGIGKTALVRHFLDAHPEVRVLRATGVSWESGLALGVAAQLAPASGTGIPEADGQEQDPEGSVLRAADRLCARWSREPSPVVVVVDDAHWADLASLRALRSALRRVPAQRVLLLLVAADDRHERVPAGTLEFLDESRDHALALGPLGPRDAKALAHRDHALVLSLATARHLVEHTGGNPLYMRQLLAELPDSAWQDWRPDLPAPRGYAASVLHRIAGCGDAARRLVEASSVCDAGTSLTEAAALGGVESPAAALDEAATAGLLTATAGPGRMTVGFPHPLTKAAVLGSLGLARRHDLHQRAARLVEGTAPGAHARSLAHRVAASLGTDAVLADELDRCAAERASAGEWAAVAGLLVESSRLSPGRKDRQNRLLRAVDAMIGAGDVPQAVTFAAELADFPAHTLRDVVLGHLAIMRGRPAEAESLLTRAWERCDAVRHPDLAAMISQRLVLHSLARWDGEALVSWARQALELVDPADPAAVESEAIMGLGLAALGRTQEGVSAYERAFDKASDDAQTQRFLMGRGWLDLALDAPENARRRLEPAVPTVFRMGSTRISLWAEGWLARTQFAMGVWPEALDTTERAAARLSEVRIELMRPLVHWTGAQIHALRGDWEAAERHVEQASVGVHRYEVMLLPACLARAQVAEARGDYERVIEAFAPVLRLGPRPDIDEPGFWPWYDVYANALVMANRAEEADAFIRPYEELALSRGRGSVLARLGHVRGRIAGAEGDIDAARAHFERALARLEPLPLPYDRARVNFAYGQTLRRAGKRREADVALKNAREDYRSLGARTYVERCDRELQAGGLHTGREGAGPSHLTAQERAVAQLVARGMSNQDTAQELFVSVKTVQYHLTHIYSKLGIRSRGELAAQFGTAFE